MGTVCQKPVHQALREFRENRGISQVFVAGKVGKKSGRISELETGAIRLTADELVDILLRGFGVSPAYFFTEMFSENETVDRKEDIK